MAELKHTALRALHVELGARMVAFAGYEMPVQYPKGIKFEHEHTRRLSGLFDISHMGQIRITGEDIHSKIESLVPGDITGLNVNKQLYTVLTNLDGGIIDDLMITNFGDSLFLVVNAGRKHLDLDYLGDSLDHNCKIEECTGRSLLALQGPASASVLGKYAPDLDRLAFMDAGKYEIEGMSCYIHRCGYTGEDGFEISVDSGDAEHLARILLQHESVEPVGLGARDTLRLEAGLCLYGNDIDEQTTPAEADLAWTIAKKYRGEKPEPAKFPGADRILVQLRDGTEYIRTGIRPEGRMPIREGTGLLNDRGENIGKITSGGYGQTVNGPIAMGYVRTEFAAADTTMQAVVRGRCHRTYTALLPFVAHHYYKKPQGNNS